MKKSPASSCSLTLILGALLMIGGGSCRNCASLNLGTPFTCKSGGDPCSFGCTPIDCTAFQPGSTCSCALSGSIPATDCRRSSQICGCKVDCTRLDPQATCPNGGFPTSCNLLVGNCLVDCRLRGGCVAQPGFESVNSDLFCRLLDGGSCRNPVPTTAAPTTTTTEARTTTTVAPTTTSTATTTTKTAPYNSYGQASSLDPPASLPMNTQRPYLAPGASPIYLTHQSYPYYLAPPPSKASQRPSPLFKPVIYYPWDHPPKYSTRPERRRYGDKESRKSE